MKLGTQWRVGRCIVCTGMRLLLHIAPFISSFFFLSNCQTLEFGQWWMYRVFQNQAAAAYSSLYSVFLQYSNIKNFRHTFLSDCEA